MPATGPTIGCVPGGVPGDGANARGDFGQIGPYRTKKCLNTSPKEVSKLGFVPDFLER